MIYNSISTFSEHFRLQPKAVSLCINISKGQVVNAPRFQYNNFCLLTLHFEYNLTDKSIEWGSGRLIEVDLRLFVKLLDLCNEKMISNLNIIDMSFLYSSIALVGNNSIICLRTPSILICFDTSGSGYLPLYYIPSTDVVVNKKKRGY